MKINSVRIGINDMKSALAGFMRTVQAVEQKEEVRKTTRDVKYLAQAGLIEEKDQGCSTLSGCH